MDHSLFSHAFECMHYHGTHPAVCSRGHVSSYKAARWMCGEWIYLLFKTFLTTFISCKHISNVCGGKIEKQLNTKLISVFIFVITEEERTMNCPFSVIMVPVLCPSQVQYYDNWRLAVPSQCTPPRQTTQPVTSVMSIYRPLKFSLDFCIFVSVYVNWPCLINVWHPRLKNWR